MEILILNCKFVNRYVYIYYGVYMGSGRGGGADQKKKKKKKKKIITIVAYVLEKSSITTFEKKVNFISNKHYLYSFFCFGSDV